jgi:hypothetical protein
MMKPFSLTLPPNRRSGQAMVELMVGMIVILALTAGMLQVASLTRAHTAVMVEARGTAGAIAMSDAFVTAFPDYIAAVEVGPDGRSYSRDDTHTAASMADFDRVIVAPSAPAAGDWDYLDAVPRNRISVLHGSPTPVVEFGLIGTEAHERIALLPAVRDLIYAADEIEVEGKVWMTWTRGIY